MAEKKKRAKTAIVTFAQQLIDASSDAIQSKTKEPPISSSAQLAPKRALDQRRFDVGAESPLFLLPSGKKSRFVSKTIESRYCRSWVGNSREQDSMDISELNALKSSIQAQGQLIPALARKLNDSKALPVTHEIIYGSRRLKACQELGIKIKVLEAELTDKDALYFMDAENASRSDLSIIEKATSYKQWIDDGIFKSSSELALALGLSKRWINKALQSLKLPKFVVESYPSLKDISRKRLDTLLACFENNPNAEERASSAIYNLREKTPDYTAEDLTLVIINATKIAKEGQGTNVQTLSSLERKTIAGLDGEEVLSILTTKSGKIRLELNSKLSPKRLGKFLDSLEKIANKV